MQSTDGNVVACRDLESVVRMQINLNGAKPIRYL